MEERTLDRLATRAGALVRPFGRGGGVAKVMVLLPTVPQAVCLAKLVRFVFEAAAMHLIHVGAFTIDRMPCRPDV